MIRHTGSKNRLIWDGDDTGITEQQYFYTCIKCGEKNQYQVKNLIEVGATPDGRLTRWMLENNLLSHDGSHYTIKSGVPAYVVPSACHVCSKSHYILIGLKEVQPQRYNIYQKSVISAELTDGKS